MQQTRMQYAALAACVLLIFPAAAFADSGYNQQNQMLVEQSYLNAALARTTCQANLETGSISAAISDIQSIDKTTIGSDSSKINTEPIVVLSMLCISDIAALIEPVSRF